VSVILLDEVMAYLRMSPSSTNVDEAVLLGTIDTAESLVAQRVGPLASGAQSSILFGGPSFVLPTTTTAITSATDLDGNAVTSGFRLGVGGVVTNSSCALGTWTLVYTAGWAELPAPIRTAVLELVSHLWRPQRGTATRPVDDSPAPGYLIPNRVRELLDPFTLPGFA
jgi:hypothetical protein